MTQKRLWSTRIRYGWWLEACNEYWGDYWEWKYSRYHNPNHRQESRDAIGCYCMGGEL